MLKKVIIFILVLVYLYTLTFDIFLNEYFKFPAVALGILIAVLFRSPDGNPHIRMRELWLLFLADFFYYAIGQGDLKPLFVNVSIFGACAVYFNFFVAYSRYRLNISVIIFFSCLALSALVMGADHIDPLTTIVWRAMLIGGEIVQSPSGICTNVFTFGYQVAALSTFVFLYTFFAKKSPVLIIIAFILCFLAIFYGMQRSALIVFIIAIVIATIFYFRFKSVPILATAAILLVILLPSESRNADLTQQNILSKAQQNSELGENRAGLVTENIKIYTDYPFGLIFYNKEWSDVTKHNPAYQGGLTSHNAYLMFITYLGPLVGIALLLAIYYPFGRIFKTALINIRDKDGALMVALCFAFLAITLNSLFHNAWLVNANGPTVFLFFCIMQLNIINSKK